MTIIKVERNEAANCINFDGSSVPAYFNACLSASFTGDNVNVKNDIRSLQLGEDFFEFSNIHYTVFRDKDNNTFANAQAAADYITLNGNVAAPTDVNVGYLGSYNASTNTPDITTDLSGFNNGDWYFITVAGTQTLSGVSYDLKVNDQVKFTASSQTWSVIVNSDARLDDIENSALAQYDLYVDADYTGTTRTGSNVHPFNNLTDAITVSSAGNSISIKGTITVTNNSTDAYTLPHGLFFYGTENAVIKYVSYDSTNGDLFYFNGTDYTQEFRFDNIDIQNAGGYGLYIKKPLKVVVKDCEFKYNGWNGTQLNTVLSSSVSGLLGYDSTQAELQAFYASTNASNGGAMRIQECPQVEITSNSVSYNLRGIRLQDCAIGGYQFVSRNRAFNNIESGIYLASSTYSSTGGCENTTVFNNVCKYNANNGILVVGGIDNMISLNIVEGNWNAGAMAWHVSNTRFRDLDLTNNNRTQYNGIGNTGDAHSSLTIGGNTARANKGYIASIINCEVYNTGLGANTSRIGLQILQDVENITGSYESNLINIDDSGFHSQDYAIDVLANLDDVKLTVGDNRYIETTETNINIASGSYYEQPFSNHITNLKECDFSIDGESVILKEGVNGVRLNPYTLHDLQASLNGSNINLLLKGSEKIQFSLSASGASIDGVALTGTDQEKVNDLNAMLQHSGSPTGQAPTITSSLAVGMEQGSTLNYELLADFGVGYEWDLSNVSGITTVEGHIRNLIGGSSLAVGTYNIPVKAINYNGEDSETLVLTVSAPAFSNTKSIQFTNQDYLGANASLLASTLGRTGNGSGSSDAWTISKFFKPSTRILGQTIFYFGDNDVTNAGHINVRFLGGNDNLRLQYGSSNNYVRFQSANNTLPANQWHHILISYDGGTTGASSADVADYYSRFKVFINGVNVISAGTWSHNNFGYTGAIDADNLRVGRYASGNYLRDNARIDELATWNSDQSANVSTIYNSGSPFDFLSLTNKPNHWWRMGDGDTYPNIQDVGTAANCTFVMYNMTSADIVSDVP